MSKNLRKSGTKVKPTLICKLCCSHYTYVYESKWKEYCKSCRKKIKEIVRVNKKPNNPVKQAEYEKKYDRLTIRRKWRKENKEALAIQKNIYDKSGVWLPLKVVREQYL